MAEDVIPVGDLIMYTILSKEQRMLVRAITPWICGTEGADKNFAPIFRDDTPEDILEKHRRLVELAKKEYGV